MRMKTSREYTNYYLAITRILACNGTKFELHTEETKQYWVIVQFQIHFNI